MTIATLILKLETEHQDAHEIVDVLGHETTVGHAIATLRDLESRESTETPW